MSKPVCADGLGYDMGSSVTQDRMFDCITLLNCMIYIHCLSPQTNHLVCISPHSDRDARLCLHPKLGSPVGRVCHSWSFRVGNHYFSVTIIRVMTTKFINIKAKKIAHISLQNSGKN